MIEQPGRPVTAPPETYNAPPTEFDTAARVKEVAAASARIRELDDTLESQTRALAKVSPSSPSFLLAVTDCAVTAINLLHARDGFLQIVRNL